MDRLWSWLETSTRQYQNSIRNVGIYLLCWFLNLLCLFLSKGQNLTTLLVYRYRATQKVRSFNRPENSALHDSTPFCHSDETPLEEGLASIQAFPDFGTGSCSLLAVHLYFRQSRRVFRIQYAPKLRSWAMVQGKSTYPHSIIDDYELYLCWRVAHRLRCFQEWERKGWNRRPRYKRCQRLHKHTP